MRAETISVITNDGRNIIVSCMTCYCCCLLLQEATRLTRCYTAPPIQKPNGHIAAVVLLVLQGVLKGYDQCINVVLDDSFERVYSTKEPVEAVELGLYIVRGDNMYEAAWLICARRRRSATDATTEPR